MTPAHDLVTRARTKMNTGQKSRLVWSGTGAIVHACGAAAMLALLASCSDQFGALGADFGKSPPAERLRAVNTLDRDRYLPPAPPEAPTVVQVVPGQAPRTALTGRESVGLTLDRVRGATLENNIDVRVALIDPSIRSQDLRAEEAKFEAVFRPFVRHNDSNSPTLDTTAANVQRSTNYGVGVDIPLRSGGRASVDIAANRTVTDNPFFAINDAYSSAATFSISQPLLRDAGRRVNSHSIRIASYNRDISEAQTKLEIIRQLANADRSYWRLYGARGELEVRQKQYELADVQLGRARRLVDAGDAAPIEVVRAEAGVAERLEAIIIAENNVVLQQRELKRLVNIPGLELETRTVILPETPPEVVRFAFDANALADLAVDNRMEMLELELRLAQDYSTIEFYKNKALPSVALDFQYSFPGVGTSLDGSIEQIRSGDFHRYSFGVSGEIPLGNEAALARVQSAILARLQRLATKDARRLAIRQETLGAIDNAETSWQRIMAARQSVIASARTYEAERRQFEAGSRTSTDVLDAASRLADAQSSEVRAIADYQIAMVDLAFATGTMLGAGQVDWAPLDPRSGFEPADGQSPGDPTPPTLPFYTDPDTRDKPINSGTHGE